MAIYKRVSQVALVAVACVYGAGILANTFLPFHAGGSGSSVPWRVYLHLTPFADTEPSDMAKNVVLFTPLGILLPLLVRGLSAVKVLFIGFLVAFAMEALQVLDAVTGHGGHIADINDLLSDTVGVVIGYCLYRIVLRLWPDSAGAKNQGV